ncbi:MAG: amidohydrolase family protein, partial [Oscillospiraceae bacterium]
SVTDMYCFGEQMGQAVLESGIKCNVSLGVTCFDGSPLRDLPKHAENQRLLRDWHNAGDGRYKLDLSIHGEYTSHEGLVREMADYARETGLRVHIHLSETKKEHEECKLRRNGKTPAQYFASTGLLDAPTTAAHCVWLEGEDFDLLREKGVTVVNNPVSNLKLASGLCKVPLLLEKGVNVALGTDGAASNNSLDLFEEMKLYALLYKGSSGDPTLVTPAQALFAATRAGALSQGRTDCGAIRLGNRADLIVLDTRIPSMQPIHSMPVNLVYSARGGDVVLT